MATHEKGVADSKILVLINGAMSNLLALSWPIIWHPPQVRKSQDVVTSFAHPVALDESGLVGVVDGMGGKDVHVQPPTPR